MNFIYVTLNKQDGKKYSNEFRKNVERNQVNCNLGR